jgi:uncharacterized membrane protein YgcG
MVPAMPMVGQTYNASATASSGLAITYSITVGQAVAETANTSASPAVCQLSQSVSGQVLFVGTGNCEITATQAGNGKYASASASQLFQIGRQNQNITFGELANATFGAPAFRVGAISSSTLPVTFNIAAGVTACSVSSNGLVNLLAEGNCSIVASQAGNGTFAPAPDVTRNFRVFPDRAGAPVLVSAAVGNQWFTVRYTEPSYLGGAIIRSYRLEVTDMQGNRYVNSACSVVAPLVCTLTGVPNNVAYTARVAAITSAGIGQFSNSSIELTPSRAQLSVTQLSADVSASGLELEWVMPEVVDGNFQRYEIYIWPAGAGQLPPATPTATLSSVNDTNVSVDIDSIVSTVADPSVSPTVAFTQPELQISRAMIAPTSRFFVFGSQPHRPVGFISLASIQSPSTASATAGYSMRVVTITDVHSSSRIVNTANGVKLGLTTPGAPTQLTLDTNDPTKIVVSWGAPQSDGGFAVLNYDVILNGDRVICPGFTTMVCEITGLTQSTTYNIEVKARNALGLGEAAAASHTTPAPPVITTQGQNEQLQLALGQIPRLNIFTPSLARPGAVVRVTGERLDRIASLSLEGAGLEYVIYGPTSIAFKVPVDTLPGRYSIIHTSSFGQVTVMDAITVLGSPVDEEFEPVAPLEPEVPLNPEVKPPAGTPEPESGSQGSSGNNGSGGTSGSGTDSGSGESEEPKPLEPTEEPAPTQTEAPANPTEPGGEEVTASEQRDQAPIMEFSLVLTLILLLLLGLLLLRFRRDRTK